jgi:peptidoglycan/LPS O-acetylase OafA/YrhL
MKPKADRYILLLLRLQGIYFILTGIWPVIDISSFMLVTCPKTDIWLVKTIGTIFFCEGVCFLLSGITREGGLPVFVLSVTNALALIIIDCYYVFSGTICVIYLGDAAAELILLFCWALILFAIRKEQGQMLTTRLR